MISWLMAAAAASQPLAADPAAAHLAGGRDAAAIALLESRGETVETPSHLINLGIAYARSGNAEKARAAFETALRSRDRMELQTATGAWVDSRALARQALVMLDRGEFVPGSQIARN